MLAHLDQRRDVVAADRGRVDEFEARGKLDFLGVGDAADFIRRTEEDALGDSPLGAKRGGQDGARLGAFRQDDALLGFAGALRDAVTKGGWRHPRLDW